jgi:hypothetical protein
MASEFGMSAIKSLEKEEGSFCKTKMGGWLKPLCDIISISRAKEHRSL